MTDSLKMANELVKIARELTALRMVDFKTRHGAILLAVVEASITGEISIGPPEPKADINVMVTSEGKKYKWLRAALAEMKRSLTKAVQVEADKPWMKRSEVPSEERVLGTIQVGSYTTMEAWSNDEYIAVRASTPRLAKAAIKIIAKHAGTTGGGVPGSTGYRGSGIISQGKDPKEYVYSYSSFGIGD